VATREQPAEAESAEAEAVTVVRYPNRRLYDRGRGRYVTLRDVEAVVRGGGTVTVRDSKTGEDLTRSVLTQILLERHPERMELFPVGFLHLMIRANEIMLGFLRAYTRQALAYAEVMQRTAALNPLAAPAEWLKAFVPNVPAAEADALARRVAELERRLEELRGTAGKPKAARRRKRNGRDKA
jgi:polyhydroxyalkanoate synthesis repressor PhaR